MISAPAYKIRETPALHRTHKVPEAQRSGSAVQVFAAVFTTAPDMETSDFWNGA